ncbi:MAG: PIG-L deacetylase family protein [Thermomicrobiales bacterium]
MSDDHPIGIPESAIALFAHPDDPEFLAGGTIARWTDAGCRVAYVIMTDGRAGDMGLRGVPDPISEAHLVQRRQEEQRAAGALLGVEDITFLGYHDGELMHTLELRRQLAREIRQRKPQAALLFDPQRRLMPGYVQHPDHWTSGEAALAALFPLAGSPRAFPELREEGLEAHAVPDLYLVAAVEPNYQVDITATIERKVAAMRCHTSQVADPERLETMMRGMAQAAAGETGYDYAEAFHFIRMGARDLVFALK